MKQLLALCVLLAASWFAMGSAQAACTGSVYAWSCATVQEAYAIVGSNGPHTSTDNTNCGYPADATKQPSYKGPLDFFPISSTRSVRIIFACGKTPGTTTGTYSTSSFANYTTGCPTGQTLNSSGVCSSGCLATDPPITNKEVACPPGTATNPAINCPYEVCSGGCAYNGVINDEAQRTINGVVYVSWTTLAPSAKTCVAGDGTGTPVIAPTDTDGDGVSDSIDGSPGNPGSTGIGTPTDTNGDGTPDCGAAGQPKCPDNTDPNNVTSTGGGDCSSPPSSTGNAIDAQIAFQTWATRCAIVGQANAGGGGTSAGKGTDMTATNSKLDAANGKLDAIKGAIDGQGKNGSCGGDGQDRCVGTSQSGPVKGDFYTPGTDTVASVFGDFKSSVSNSPLISVADDFFGGCNVAGECPMATWDAPEFGIHADLSALCDGTLDTILTLAGYTCLAAAAFLGFKWALVY